MNDKLRILITNLESPCPEKRKNALYALGDLDLLDLGDSISPIAYCLGDPDADVRGLAACILGQFNNSSVIKPLVKVVKEDASDQVRAEALATLSNFKNQEIYECLVTIAHRKEVSNRCKHEVAKQLKFYDCDKAVDALVVLLGDWDANTRDFASESLLHLNRPRLKPVWEKALSDRSHFVKTCARKALKALKKV